VKFSYHRQAPYLGFRSQIDCHPYQLSQYTMSMEEVAPLHSRKSNL